MKKSIWHHLALASAAALLLSASASATTITTTSYSSWLTDLTGSATELNFNPIAYTSYNTATGITLSTSAAPNVSLGITGPSGAGYALTGVQYSGVKSLEGGSATGAEILANASGGTNAFLVSVATTGNTAVTMDLSDGEAFTFSPGLFAVALSNTVTSFSLSTSSGSQVVLDDAYFGVSGLTQSAPPPTDTSDTVECGTLLLMGGGLLFLFIARPKSPRGRRRPLAA